MTLVVFGLFDWIDRGIAPLHQLYKDRLRSPASGSIGMQAIIAPSRCGPRRRHSDIDADDAASDAGQSNRPTDYARPLAADNLQSATMQKNGVMITADTLRRFAQHVVNPEEHAAALEASRAASSVTTARRCVSSTKASRRNAQA